MMRWAGFLLLLLSSLISISYGSAYAINASGAPDFKAVYYGARCLIQHHNPYKESELESVYRAEGGERPSDSLRQRQVVTQCVNLPTTLLFITPLALLPYGIAQAFWLVLTAGLFILAACLMWHTGKDYAPGIALFLVCIVLANSEVLFAGGNTAGIAVSLCVVAVWCLLQDRYIPVGILFMSVSLAIKPHDSGFVWLYLFLARGVYRKRALQTLVLTAVMALTAVLWISSVAPTWMGDWKSNLLSFKTPGGLNAPGVLFSNPGNIDMIISLQSVVSVFHADPRIYNSVSYLVCGVIVIIWMVITLRSRFTMARAWLALATIIPLTMLVTYHRPWDAKLLILAIPACAMLWTEGGRIGRIAFVANVVGIVLTGDIPLVILSIVTRRLHTTTTTLFGQILTVLIARPLPFLMLIMGIFSLWIYQQYALPGSRPESNKRVLQHDSDIVEDSIGAKGIR